MPEARRYTQRMVPAPVHTAARTRMLHGPMIERFTDTELADKDGPTTQLLPN